MRISVIIPVYQSVDTLLAAWPRVYPHFRECFKDFEFLVVVDNPFLETGLRELNDLEKEFTQLRLIRLRRNYGQHFATLCGYYFASGARTISVDEDLFGALACLGPEILEYPEPITYWHYGKDNMYTSRLRKSFSRAFRMILGVLTRTGRHSTFRMTTSALNQKILEDKHIYWNLDMMLYHQTHDTVHRYLPDIRLSDEHTAYTPAKLFRYALKIVYEYANPVINLLLSVILAASVGLVFSMEWMLPIFLISWLGLTLFFRWRLLQTGTTTEKIEKAAEHPIA